MTNATTPLSIDPHSARFLQHQLKRLRRYDGAIAAAYYSALGLLYLALLGGVVCLGTELMLHDGVMALPWIGVNAGIWITIRQVRSWLRKWNSRRIPPPALPSWLTSGKTIV